MCRGYTRYVVIAVSTVGIFGIVIAVAIAAGALGAVLRVGPTASDRELEESFRQPGRPGDAFEKPVNEQELL